MQRQNQSFRSQNNQRQNYNYGYGEEETPQYRPKQQNVEYEEEKEYFQENRSKSLPNDEETPPQNLNFQDLEKKLALICNNIQQTKHLQTKLWKQMNDRLKDRLYQESEGFLLKPLDDIFYPPKKDYSKNYSAKSSHYSQYSKSNRSQRAFGEDHKSQISDRLEDNEEDQRSINSSSYSNKPARGSNYSGRSRGGGFNNRGRGGYRGGGRGGRGGSFFQNRQSDFEGSESGFRSQNSHYSGNNSRGGRDEFERGSYRRDEYRGNPRGGRGGQRRNNIDDDDQY